VLEKVPVHMIYGTQQGAYTLYIVKLLQYLLQRLISCLQHTSQRWMVLMVFRVYEKFPGHQLSPQSNWTQSGYIWLDRLSRGICLSCLWSTCSGRWPGLLHLSRFLLNYLLIVLNVAELLQALAEPYAGWFYSSRAVYWVTWLWVEPRDLIIAELSS